MFRYWKFITASTFKQYHSPSGNHLNYFSSEASGSSIKERNSIIDLDEQNGNYRDRKKKGTAVSPGYEPRSSRISDARPKGLNVPHIRKLTEHQGLSKA